MTQRLGITLFAIVLLCATPALAELPKEGDTLPAFTMTQPPWPRMRRRWA